MYNDILPGILLLGALSAGFFWLGWYLTAHVSARYSGRIALGVVVLLVVCLIYLQDSLYLAKILPFPGVVVLGSAALPLIALLAGSLIGRHRQDASGRKAGGQVIIPSLLVSLGIVHASRPFWGTPPPISSIRMKDGIVLQTSESSCSAASAATLLTVHGIRSSEAEMANLCFTRNDGTSMLGVYRGLFLKTQGTGFRVATLAGGTAFDLMRITQRQPILLSVGLDRLTFQKIDPRYTEEWGWTPGKRHAVILFGFSPEGYLDIGDPSVGREKWRVQSLGVLWHGDGIYLTPK